MTAAQAWAEAGRVLTAVVPAPGAVELRVTHGAGAAVRVGPGRGVVRREHAGPGAPAAPWVLRGRCGSATAWALAASPPPDGLAVATALEPALVRAAALDAQERAQRATGAAAALLDDLTHHLRTDVATLHTVAWGLASGTLDDDAHEVLAVLPGVGEATQARLTRARCAGAALVAPAVTGDLCAALDEALAAGGRVVSCEVPDGERPRVLLAEEAVRQLGEILAGDPRLGHGPVRVVPDPIGWAVVAGGPEPALGPPRALAASPATGLLVTAAWLAEAAGGSATVADAEGGLLVRLALPAGPPEAGA